MKQFKIGRLMWWPPTTLTCWWKPTIFKGEDEFCNPSIAAIIPPFGALILFWRPGPLRTRPCTECAALNGENDLAD